MLEGITEGSLDLGICFSRLPHPEVEMSTIHAGNLFIGVRKNHPLLKISVKKRFLELVKF